MSCDDVGLVSNCGLGTVNQDPIICNNFSFHNCPYIAVPLGG